MDSFVAIKIDRREIGELRENVAVLRDPPIVVLENDENDPLVELLGEITGVPSGREEHGRDIVDDVTLMVGPARFSSDDEVQFADRVHHAGFPFSSVGPDFLPADWAGFGPTGFGGDGIIGAVGFVESDGGRWGVGSHVAFHYAYVCSYARSVTTDGA
ncbi:B-block binding subunit of TFIIIC [Striga asiatica]|uniref:B-block binding subunit of TFIIIC n=1 Tax=Striga asiatica TaxID=4170 RepID=A0A5A7NZX2_STRAF|nr:B-block binding subunit of TFIIIC [Striga asiatica]